MKRKGISLIVLIITIVVIIILGTAIIVSVAKTNIINNANEATLKSDVANLKSELEMYVTDQFVATKGKYDRAKLNADVGQAKYNEENVEDKNKDGKTNIYDVLNSLKNSNLDGAIYIQEGNIVFIRSKFNSSQLKVLAKMGEEIDGTPKITDIVSKSDFTSITVSADVTNPVEVEKYIYILNDGEGVETTESSKTFEGLEPATKYTVTIKALLKDGTEIEMVKEISTLDNTPPIEPVINSSYGYPLLTLDGIVDGGETTIVFDTSEGVKNEYSLDGGITWNVYKGSFNISKNCTLIAKSLKQNGLESSITKEIVIPDNAIPDDAIPGDAYDEKPDSYITTDDRKIMYIKEEMVGERINIDVDTGKDGNFPNYIYFVNSNGDDIKTYTLTADQIIEIPSGTIKLEYLGSTTEKSVWAGTHYARLHEISIVTTPVITYTEAIYPELKLDGVAKGGGYVKIKYFPTLSQRLYKIGDGEWKEYEDKEIKLLEDDIIYAKGIDKDGNETITESYTMKAPSDSIAYDAYDKDEESYITTDDRKYIYINEEMIGQRINVNAISGKDGNFPNYIYFVNSNGDDIKTYTLTAAKTITIPEGAVKMEYLGSTTEKSVWAGTHYARLVEISVVTTPLITYTEAIYPELKLTGVEKGGGYVKINYFPTLSQKLYKIGDGEWKEYEDKEIKVLEKEIIYAKGIDKDGNETSIDSYTMKAPSDAISCDAYDEKTDSYVTTDDRKYIYINEEMIGKSVNVNAISGKGGNFPNYIYFVNSNGDDVETHKLTSAKTITIPSGTVKMEYLGSTTEKSVWAGTHYARLVEITVPAQ